MPLLNKLSISWNDGLDMSFSQKPLCIYLLLVPSSCASIEIPDVQWEAFKAKQPNSRVLEVKLSPHQLPKPQKQTFALK
jgi:hypothetical protein